MTRRGRIALIDGGEITRYATARLLAHRGFDVFACADEHALVPHLGGADLVVVGDCGGDLPRLAGSLARDGVPVVLLTTAEPPPAEAFVAVHSQPCSPDVWLRSIDAFFLSRRATALSSVAPPRTVAK